MVTHLRDACVTANITRIRACVTHRYTFGRIGGMQVALNACGYGTLAHGTDRFDGVALAKLAWHLTLYAYTADHLLDGAVLHAAYTLRTLQRDTTLTKVHTVQHTWTIYGHTTMFKVTTLCFVDVVMAVKVSGIRCHKDSILFTLFALAFTILAKVVTAGVVTTGAARVHGARGALVVAVCFEDGKGAASAP